MNRVDEILSALTRAAKTIAPSSKFNFSISYSEKENLFVVSIYKDYGHPDGPNIFLQSSGSSTVEATQKLADKFQSWLQEYLAVLYADFNKQEKVFIEKEEIAFNSLKDIQSVLKEQE